VNNITDKRQLLLEYSRCAIDPAYAIESYFETFDLTQESFIPFKLFQPQKELINNYEENHYNIVRKYRQAGVTTVTSAYAAIKCAFANEKNPERVLILANKQETAIEFLNKISSFIKQLPSWVDISYVKSSQKHVILSNKSEIKAVATSADALRGYTPTIMILDEAAFIDGGQELWGACLASISTGGKPILISCVTGDSYIFTNKGIEQIKDYVSSDILGFHSIDEYNVLGKDQQRKGNQIYNNGKVDTLILKTAYSELESSYTHKFWSYKLTDKKYGWNQISDLSVGDYVSVQYGKNIWGKHDDCKDFTPSTFRIKNDFAPNKITKDISYLMGLYISEGSTNIQNNKKTGITISCGDDITDVFHNLNLPYYTNDQLHYTISSYNLIEFLEYMGFDLSFKAKNKIIPKRLLEMSRDNIIALMQGIMDGDGWTSYNKNKNVLRVGIGLSSLELIKQIRIILNNFGVLTEYKEYLTPKTKKVNVTSIQHRIIANNKFAKKYFDEIGFRLKRKNDVNKFDESKLRHSGCCDNIPNGSEIIKNLYLRNKKRGVLKELKEN